MSRPDPETRQRILDAARQVFSTSGYREGRIAEIARLADVSPATIYSYFLGKRDLFQALDIAQLEDLHPEFERKRAHILSQARHLFSERGFHGTTIESIARRAGYSKAGLYQFFPSKEALFEAVIHETKFQADLLQKPPGAAEDATLSQALQRIALSYVRMFDDPEQTAMFRIVMSESIRHPEIGEAYHAKGIGFVIDQVAQCLASFREAEGLQGINLLYAARAYVSMFGYAVELKAAPSRKLDEPTNEELVVFLTDWFLHGLLPHPPEESGTP